MHVARYRQRIVYRLMYFLFRSSVAIVLLRAACIAVPKPYFSAIGIEADAGNGRKWRVGRRRIGLHRYAANGSHIAGQHFANGRSHLPQQARYADNMDAGSHNTYSTSNSHTSSTVAGVVGNTSFAPTVIFATKEVVLVQANGSSNLYARAFGGTFAEAIILEAGNVSGRISAVSSLKPKRVSVGEISPCINSWMLRNALALGGGVAFISSEVFTSPILPATTINSFFMVKREQQRQAHGALPLLDYYMMYAPLKAMRATVLVGSAEGKQNRNLMNVCAGSRNGESSSHSPGLSNSLLESNTEFG